MLCETMDGFRSESTKQNKNSGESSSAPEPQSESQNQLITFMPGSTVSEMLDRLEVLAGKIGMNSADQSIELLCGLDAARERINRLEGTTSRKVVESQFADITARLRSEPANFLKDLGGAPVLDSLRQQRQPSQQNWWWYLDQQQAQTRKSGLRKLGFSLVGITVGVLLAALVYNLFLAPDPATVARYQAENAARDFMTAGQLDEALAEVETGLVAVPGDPSLLVLKGVILEQRGQEQLAQQVLLVAKQHAGSREEFFQMLGQAYLMVSRYEDALTAADDMLKENPQSAQAYLLIGQVQEVQRQYSKAFDSYTRAYDLADAQEQTQLAGLARVKMAMVLQLMNAPGAEELK